MKNLEQLKQELEECNKVISLYDEIIKHRALKSIESIDYDENKKKKESLDKTIRRLEYEIPYTKKEKEILKRNDSKEWIAYLKQCNLKNKNIILRVLSMISADGVIPVFRKEGIDLSEREGKLVYSYLKENGYVCTDDLINDDIQAVIEKIKSGTDLNTFTEREKELVNSFINIKENNDISLKPNFKAIDEEKERRYNRKTKSGYRDYLIDRCLMILSSFRPKLASGEKEFIAGYFNNDWE